MNEERITITKVDKKLRGEGKTEVITVRLKPSIIAKMQDIATRTGRSRNEVIAIILEKAKVDIK